MAKQQYRGFQHGYDNNDNMGGPMPMPGFQRQRFVGDFRNKRYIEAFGSYSGGYGPPPRPLLSLEPSMSFTPWPPGPPMRGGMGPLGPPPLMNEHDDQAAKFLLRCGVPKETIRNLPSDLLQLIQPQYCGLCAIHFDTYKSSRFHYVSKNHLKAQKRWIHRRRETIRDVPLKARQLYCELCDVHITSSQHAESHYSGKSHRAIVEGRKNPKNPILMQKCSKKRLQQLIRRELKHLKPVTEVATPVETSEIIVPVQDDLYCDICKTSVTCAEQMTMHLNGKRHLTKEKQHIYKMMRGEASETVVQETQTAKSDGEEAQQAETTEAVAEEAEQAEPTETVAEEAEQAETTETVAEEDALETEDTDQANENNSDWGVGTGTWEV